jgi:CheY-like chemotaxis protein
MGAMGILAKPIKTKEALERAFDHIKAFVDHSTRKILLVAPKSADRRATLDLIGGDDVETSAAESPEEALSQLHDRRFDCVVFEPDTLDENIVKFVETAGTLWDDASMPLIVYSPQELPPEVDARLKRLMQGMAVKRVASPAELLNQTALYLHRPVAKMPEPLRAMLDDLHPNSSVLAGKKVLIVDDDIRNIFAVTSVLERHQMLIASAETGRSAIEMLQNDPEIDIVLMDIMMPEMDGHDTMRAIRKLPQFKNLPIVAVTAKAMKGDREKCIESGAWDYLSKPIDSEQMLRVLRAWLCR